MGQDLNVNCRLSLFSVIRHTGIFCLIWTITVAQGISSPSYGERGDNDKGSGGSGEITLTKLDTNPQNNIETLVSSLQSELQAATQSQERSRSILIVIQETQEAQQRDLNQLKDEIVTLKRKQEDDRDTMVYVKTLTEDNMWAINDIKGSQQQLSADFVDVKESQINQNDTLSEVQDIVDVTAEYWEEQRRSFQNVRREMNGIKQAMSRDRDAINRLQREVKSRMTNHWSKDNNTYPNHIPNIPIPNHEPASIPDNSAELSGRVEDAEESDNKVEHKITKLIRNENLILKDIDTFRNRFLYFDSEMAKIYTSIFNLSSQFKSMENKMLTNQKKRVETDIGDLQKTFWNFTQQMFHLEKWHETNKDHLNSSVQNTQNLNNLEGVMGNHDVRIKTLEQLVLDNRLSNKHNYDMFSTYFSTLNVTITAFQQRLFDHRSKASNVFENVDDQILEFHDKIKHHDHRLAKVEVQVLNNSLKECQKSSSDTIQDMKLSDFDREVTNLDERLLQQDAEVTRLDRGVSRLFRDSSSQGTTLKGLLDHVSQLMTLFPDVSSLQHQVENFIMQLPKDCGEKLSTGNWPDGPYLLKPERSMTSARAYCEGEEDGPIWTVIQRRDSGDVSFARSWVDYKMGFGDPGQEFWIGNENLHYLTTQSDYKLRIDLWDLNNVYRYAEYMFFKVDEESAHYRLHLDGYAGNATDALQYSNFMPFSTIDRDNDVSSTHCAKFYTAGWWYKHCHYANLNGRYTVGVVWFDHDVDEWVQMKKTVMRITPITGNYTVSAET